MATQRTIGALIVVTGGVATAASLQYGWNEAAVAAWLTVAVGYLGANRFHRRQLAGIFSVLSVVAIFAVLRAFVV